MSHISEPELLRQIQAGREEALVALHARYANAVYSVAYRVLNDQMAAEEVTQDTFMRLWDRAQTYDPGRGAFVTWLLTITRRLAIDTFRKRDRDALRDPVYVDDNIDLWENLLETDDGGDLRRSIVSLVSALPEVQRQAIELAYFYGMSHSEIADYLNAPLGTIKTRIRLGMDKLREAWAAETLRDPKRATGT